MAIVPAMSEDELRNKAATARRLAGSATGEKYHRLMQKAQGLDAEADDLKRRNKRIKGVSHA